MAGGGSTVGNKVHFIFSVSVPLLSKSFKEDMSRYDKDAKVWMTVIRFLWEAGVFPRRRRVQIGSGAQTTFSSVAIESPLPEVRWPGPLPPSSSGVKNVRTIFHSPTRRHDVLR
jgi:hypothetical protein